MLSAVLLLSTGVSAEDRTVPVDVRTGKGRQGSEWKVLQARTVGGLEGFKPSREPECDIYGGWKVAELGATGFFRVQQWRGRWWFVTPEGHPFICRAVNHLEKGPSENSISAFKEKYDGQEDWFVTETEMLRENGFNSAAAWSCTSYIRKRKSGRIPYIVILSPMFKYLKSIGRSKAEYKVSPAGDEGFDEFVESEMKKAEQYRDDPYCIGYFIDNEQMWRGDGAADGLDVYLKKVTGELRKHDPNHLFLGCRFNTWNEELRDERTIRVAGKYMDVVSVNHYSFWNADWRHLERITRWSGKPVMITEFYTKGEDSGLGNKSGGGWIVRTQKDRGTAYQHFVLSLLECRSCVGWNWFRYMDNDPSYTKGDPSNRDANKGIVDIRYNRYDDLLAKMKEINVNSYALALRYSGNNLEGKVVDASTGKGLPGIRVSDGLGIVTTDSNGRYVMKTDASASSVWVSVPEGYGFENCVSPLSLRQGKMNRCNFKLVRSDSRRKQNLPKNYSYDEGNVHYVMLDNSIGDKVGISRETYRWLQDDLDFVSEPSQTKLVLVCTMPMGGSPDWKNSRLKQRHVMALLKGFKEVEFKLRYD